MKKLQLHSSGKDDSKEALKEQFNFKKNEIKNNANLSKEEKLLQIKKFEVELSEKN